MQNALRTTGGAVNQASFWKKLIFMRRVCDHPNLSSTGKTSGCHDKATDKLSVQDTNELKRTLAELWDSVCPICGVSILFMDADDVCTQVCDVPDCGINQSCCFPTLQEMVDAPCITKCKHVFCGQCILIMLEQEEHEAVKCPAQGCRKSCTSKQVYSWKCLGGQVEEDTSSSSKIDAVMFELSIVPPGEKTLIFSQWTAMLDKVECVLQGAKYKYRRLDGSMGHQSRQKVVEEFKKKPEVSEKNLV